MTNNRWDSVKPEMLDFVFEQADKHLAAQLTMGIASDARAISIASIFIGFSGVIVAATTGYWAAIPSCLVLAVGISIGVTLFIAALCCFWAARPVDFYYPGNQPDNWYDVLSSDLTESKAFEIENYDQIISENAKILATNAKWLAAGFIAASLSPVIGVVVAILVI